jgi:very-short-patch-repair endonuclease/exonuclease VII small subunit
VSPTEQTAAVAMERQAPDGQKLDETAGRLERAASEMVEQLEALSEAGEVNLEDAELDFEAGEASVSHVDTRLGTISENLDTLRDFSIYRASLTDCEETLADDFVHRALGSGLEFGQYVAAFRKAFLQNWVEAVADERPVLQDFRGDRHERRISDFQQLDEASKQIAQERTKAFLQEQRKKVGAGELSNQLQLVRKEAQKKSKIMPIRKILRRAPKAVQLLQPCFLMSPLSVAKYTDPEKMQFDVVIFDEASQIPPADAVGSIIRGDQVVVVGDSKQLPPTSFFGSEVEDYSELQEQDMEELEDLESILDEAKVSGLPSMRLKWHYRSKDESLIRFSNEEFYSDDPLYTFPSATREDSNEGLEFEYLEESTYDGGGVNEAEAKRVADAVVEHIRERPGLSLGVGTFGMQQRTQILDILERRRRENSSIEWFFTDDGEEKFFVKNLENIQGDDRDVIFISVTYGPDENGKVRRNFGPINQDGGWRRLNVLTTRAKQQVRVFSSMRGDDIRVQNISEGAQLLRKYLKYAETGNYPSPNISRGSTESPFERAVKEAVERMGYRVVPQVGEAGYRIDLGVLDPENPGRYILGIECDGASYHSAETVRDRDRIRQQVLEDRGWTIHRIWSMDWFHDQCSVLKELDEALDSAREAHRNSLEEASEEGSAGMAGPDTGNDSQAPLSIDREKTVADGGADSEFEHEVGVVIEDLGWEIDRQVEVAGYRVDIGVCDPSETATYLCGVECDGASYHRGDAKREQDEVRKQSIEDAGLNLYHIWSTDWRENRSAEERELQRFLENLHGSQLL